MKVRNQLTLIMNGVFLPREKRFTQCKNKSNERESKSRTVRKRKKKQVM